MAICKECNQEMSGDNPADSCTVRNVLKPNDDVCVRDTYHFDEPSGRCHDCNIKHGGYHHPGCDVERCPWCSGQLISCGCLSGEEW